MTNKKIIIPLLFSIIFYSCNENKTEYYANGNVFKIYSLNKNGKLQGDYKEFYDNGELKEISIYENGVKVDSSLYFNNGKINRIDYYLGNDTLLIKNFEKGKIRSKGKFYKGQKVHIWEYYSENEKKEKVFEYINLCGKQYTNQGWYFNHNGDTLIKNSNFYKLNNFSNKIKHNEALAFQMFYKPILENSNSFICLSPLIEEDFCNINNVTLDTIFAVNSNNIFDIHVSFSKIGNRNLRGFITEYTKRTVSNDSAEYNERKVYFDIPLTIY